MTTARTFLRASLVTAVVGVMTYCASDDRPGLALLTVAAALGSRLMMRDGVLRTLPRWAINTLVLVATVHVFFRLATIHGPGQSVITELTDFLVYILLVKFFDRGKVRDEAQLLGLSLFVVIGAVLTSNRFAVGAGLIFYTPLAIATTILFQVYAGVQRAEERAAWRRRRETGVGTPLFSTPGALSSLRWTSLGAIVASVTLAVAAFILTPRTLSGQTGEWGSGGRGGAETGFRDQISLGQAGGISVSTEPVMDVQLADAEGQPIGDRAEPLYLRGAVLDTYDPRTGTWTTAKRGDTPADPNQPRGRRFRREEFDTGGPGRVLPIGGWTGGRLRLTQTVTVRQSREGRSPIFAAWRPVQISLDAPGSIYLTGTGVGSAGGAVTMQRAGPAGRFGYTVESVPDANEEVEPLEVPAFEAPKVKELAERLLNDANVPLSPTGREPSATRRAVSAIVDHLRRTCSYTLEMVAPAAGQDPIEMFLFDTKRGHCEYFAAAMTALCRSVGIDARIVTGYAGGEYNDVTGQYVIRKADAHAWVEVRIRPDRWETVDPTPPGSLSVDQRRNAAGSGLLAWARTWWEAAEFRWANSVVSFSRGPRLDIVAMGTRHRERVAAIGEAISNMRSAVARGLSLSDDGTAGLVFAGLVVGGLVALAWLGRRMTGLVVGVLRERGLWAGGRGAGVRSRDPRYSFYWSALSALERAGVGKPSHVPPLAHAQSLERADPALAAAVSQVATAYYAARFGGVAVDAPVAAELGRRLEGVLRRSGKGPNN